MDVISLSKASKALRDIQKLDKQTVAPDAESHFINVDARIDWMESQAAASKTTRLIDIILSQGKFDKTEYVDGKIQLKKIGSVDAGVKENIIPVMTSSIAPSGIAESSGSYNANYPGWKAFNGKIGGLDVWWSNSSSVNDIWISYEFPSPKKIIKYTLTQGGTSYTSRNPLEWDFQGYENGVWVTLDKQSSIVWTDSEVKVFSFTNNKTFQNYRLWFPSKDAVVIREIQMSESGLIEQFTSDGTWESPIIDLSDGYLETLNLTHIKNGFNEDDTFEIRYGDAPTTLSVYEPYIAQKPKARYVQFKAYLKGTPSTASTKSIEMNDESLVMGKNAYVKNDGDLSLIRSYTFRSSVVNQNTEGMIHKTDLRQVDLKKINTIRLN